MIECYKALQFVVLSGILGLKGGSMRKNPDQRTVDLRAKYRAKHDDDWWQDEDIKAEYRAERREIYRDGPPSDPTGKGSRPSQQKSTASKRKTKSKPKNVKARGRSTSAIFKDMSSNFGKFNDWLGEPQKGEDYLTIDRTEMIVKGKEVGGAQIHASIDNEHGVSEWIMSTTGQDGEIYLSGSVQGEDFDTVFSVTGDNNLENMLEGFMNWALSAQTDGGMFKPFGSKRKRSRKTTRKVTRRDPIKAMAVVFGTKSSKKASSVIVGEVSKLVPDGVSVTRKDLKTRSNFTVQTDDGQKMVVSVTPAGRTTIKQYTSDGDKHFEQSFTLDEWLDGQKVIEIYLNDVMVEYGEEDVVRPPKDKQMQKLPKKVSKAFFTIVNKLEELSDSLHNDTGLYYNHVTDEFGGVIIFIELKDIPRKPRLNVDFSNDIKVIKGRSVKEYKLSSTTAAFNYIKKWIESNSQKANPRRRKNPMYLITLDEGKGDGEMHYLVENAKNATEAKKKFLANRFPLRPLGRNATIKASLYKSNGKNTR